MYAIGMINLGKLGMRVPCGNDGFQKIHNKTERGWKSETQTMAKCVDEVWVVSDFTQEMCEMSPSKLANYVMEHGRRIY